MSRSPFWIDSAAFSEAFRKAGVTGSSAPAQRSPISGFQPTTFSAPVPRQTTLPEPAEDPGKYEDSETVEVPRLTRQALAAFQAAEIQSQAQEAQSQAQEAQSQAQEAQSQAQEAQRESEEEIDVAEVETKSEGQNLQESQNLRESQNPPEGKNLPESEAVPEFQDLDDHLQVRLAAFLDWIEKRTQAEGIFVVDDEGLVLLERETDPDWVALSSYLMNFHKRIRKSFDILSSASLAIDLESGGILHWLYADTQLGPHVLGIFVREPIPRKLSKSFQTTLAFVMRQASH